MHRRTKWVCVFCAAIICLLIAIGDAIPFTQERALAFAEKALRETMGPGQVDKYEVIAIDRKGHGWMLLFESKEHVYFGDHFAVHVRSKYSVEVVPGR